MKRPVSRESERTGRESPKPALSIGSRFSKFDDEEEIAVAPSVVEERTSIKELRKAWATCGVGEVHDSLYGDYERLKEKVMDIQYSSEDVELFSLIIADFQEEKIFSRKAGIFLSALVNAGKDDNYTIRTNHLEKSIENLGYRNTKNLVVKGFGGGTIGSEMEGGSITVHGNVADWAGIRMKGGSIIVNGDAGAFVGSWMKNGTIMIKGNAGGVCSSNMKGGSVTVEGNAGHMAGEDMCAGTLIIKGDAGERLAENMKGGEIFVGGSIESLGKIKGGKVYKNGKLIAGM
jgi:hypothetical protein